MFASCLQAAFQFHFVFQTKFVARWDNAFVVADAVDETRRSRTGSGGWLSVPAYHSVSQWSGVVGVGQ